MKLPDIPPGWNWKRLKYVADLQTGITLGKDYGSRDTTLRPYLRVANVQDGYLDLETITEIAIPEREASRCELRDGDVLMTEGGDFDKLGRGYVWTGQIPGCLHQNHVFAVRPRKEQLDSRFLSAVMTSHHGKAYFTSTSQQTTNLACTNSTKIREFPIPLPPLDTQNRILSQLDCHTAMVDSLTERKERLIALLEEKRAALIDRAVTKGLNPGAWMKESGVSWLGLIPAHWEVKRLKNISVGGLVNGLFKTKDDYGEGTPLINVVDVYEKDHRIRFDNLGRVRATTADVDRYRVLSGDVFFVRSSLKLEGTGASCLADHVPESAVFECHLVRLRPEPGVAVPRFLSLYLNSARVRQRIVAMAQTTTMSTIGQNELACLPILLPPIPEQEQISAVVDADAHRIDHVIHKTHEQIAKLQEHRAALISAAVTGKIDVGESAEA